MAKTAFLMDAGTTHALAGMLESNTDNESVTAWLLQAQPGDQFGDVTCITWGLKMAIDAVRQDYPDMTVDELRDEAADMLAGWEAERADHVMLFGAPEDTPCLQSADLWGTGEGRYHGVI